MKLSPLCTALLAGAVLLPGMLDAQIVEGRIQSRDGNPVVEAKVILLDGSFQPVGEDVTDEAGLYRIESTSEGEHVIVVEREGFASHSTDPFVLDQGDTVLKNVTVSVKKVGESGLLASDTLSDADLLANAIADACRETFVPSMHAILYGAVKDSATGMAVPGADAVVEWDNAFALEGQDSDLRGRSDDAGAFLICNVPASEPITVQASALDREGSVHHLRLNPGTMRRLDLNVPVADPDQPGDILGRIVDQDTGEPVEGAEVHIKDTGFEGLTNDRGVFQIADIPWGLYAMSVDHIAYGHHEEVVQVIGGRAHDLEIRISKRAIDVAPILVRVKPRRWFGDMVGLEHRIKLGLGEIRTREDLDKTMPRNLAEAVRGLPGVDVVQSGGSVGGSYTVQLRGARNMANQICQPAVWVDGIKWGRGGDAFSQVMGWEIEVVEVYKGPSQVPGEFLDQDSNCGVIVVWTRRGRFSGF